jgi:hypothetical protein
MGIKNAESDADFGSVKKVAKRLMRKELSVKSDRKKKWSFLLLLLRAKVFAL